MKEKEKVECLKFELLSEDHNGVLVSGFSDVQSHVGGFTTNTTTNNCHGSNCVPSCGAG